MSELHISGPCAAAYARGCRCPDCRQAWRESARRQQGRRAGRTVKPSLLALEVARLNTEADAMELNLQALRDENAMLRCRIDELEWSAGPPIRDNDAEPGGTILAW